MYFCPCSCAKPDGENEEDVLICLPRNLSYARESYLDHYSVSAAFVHKPKSEKQMRYDEAKTKYVKGASAREELLEDCDDDDDKVEEDTFGREVIVSETQAMADIGGESKPACDSHVMNGGGETKMPLRNTPDTLPPLPPITTASLSTDTQSSYVCSPLTVTIDNKFSHYLQPVESPDSDMVSEEGIFVNMMDDLDPEEGETTNGKSTFSEASDDTCVSGDSMFYSPEELIDDDDLHQDLQNLSLQADGLSGEPFCESPPLNDVRPGDTSDSETLVGVPVVFGLHDEQHQNDTGASETDTNASACAINDAHSSDQHSTKDGAKDSDKKQDSSGGLSITVREWSPHKSDSGGAGAADKGASLDSSYHDLLSPGSSVYEDQEFNFTRAELRKSTSLKSTKTPPGTPRQKKVVRFADAMGLDLESVRHILNLESPPKVPASALKDLQSGLTYDRRSMGTKHIVETFAQPGADINFRDRVLGQKVVLENALVVSGCITGLVRVANISYHKTVRVRFTANNWNTFHDITASYMLNSNDGATDRFSFTISLPPELGPGGRLQFAVSYNVGGIEYWDNNNGQNYVFECFAKTTPTEVENAWMHFL